jgi:AraC-like DNA-binding protein
MPRTVQNGWFHFVDDLAIEGTGASPFVIGRAWMIEFVELTDGSMAFVSDDREIVPKAARFAIFYAPFSIVNLSIDNPRGKVEGLGSIDVPPDLPDTPMLFDSSNTDPDELESLIRSARAGIPIPQNSKSSLTSLRTKRIIDQKYTDDFAIAEVAANVGVSHEHLTRQFRKDFAMAPLEYLHKLRMADANFKLSDGSEIIDVSADVGYNDLGRFYKQFRKAFSTTPGSCK